MLIKISNLALAIGFIIAVALPCNVHAAIPAGERAALKAIYNNTGGTTGPITADGKLNHWLMTVLRCRELKILGTVYIRLKATLM